MNTLPRLADKIEINEVEDGYIIYQSEKDRVHYLNHTAVIVLECCTGKNTVEDIERIVQKAYEMPEAPEKEVRDCLNTLFNEGLIE
ncbi:MAG: PqqD family protein [Thermodesulfobacteriota bacterium]|nr:PqqD family protein [Thermodesulfobacteriota bacterium]